MKYKFIQTKFDSADVSPSDVAERRKTKENGSEGFAFRALKKDYVVANRKVAQSKKNDNCFANC